MSVHLLLLVVLMVVKNGGGEVIQCTNLGSEDKELPPQTLYKTGTDVTLDPVEREYFWLIMAESTVVITEYRDVVEGMPVDQTCVRYAITAIPDCLAVVCGADPICRQEAATECSTDVSLRVALNARQREFENLQLEYARVMGTLQRFVRQLEVAEGKAWWPGAAAVAGTIVNAVRVEELRKSGKNIKARLENQQKQLNENGVLFAAQQRQIDNMTQALESTSKAVQHTTDMIMKLGDTITNVSMVLDDNVRRLTGRVTELQQQINRRFTETYDLVQVVSDTINSDDNELYRTIQTLYGNIQNAFARLQQSDLRRFRATQYIYRMLTYGIDLERASEKMARLLDIYRDCFQALTNNMLYSCPVNQPFIKQFPSYVFTRNVYGSVYLRDEGYLLMLYRIPTEYETLMVHKVYAKSVLIGGKYYVPDSSHVVMLPDGKFYRKPVCEGKFCPAFLPETQFPLCLAALKKSDSEKIFLYCKLLLCGSKTCDDRIIKPTQVPATWNIGEPVLTFALQDEQDDTSTVSETVPVAIKLPSKEEILGPYRPASYSLTRIVTEEVQIDGVQNTLYNMSQVLNDIANAGIQALNGSNTALQYMRVQGQLAREHLAEMAALAQQYKELRKEFNFIFEFDLDFSWLSSWLSLPSLYLIGIIVVSVAALALGLVLYRFVCKK